MSRNAINPDKNFMLIAVLKSLLPSSLSLIGISLIKILFTPKEANGAKTRGKTLA
ncbi:hypothetical protein GCM10027085_07890 [Spirosoma aerophilum]